MDEVVPNWIRKIFPWVDQEEWEKEKAELKMFKKNSEFAFGKQFRYPSKAFNDFQSFESVETAEGDASSSFTASKPED